MTNVPFRSVGSLGLIKDRSPFDLEIGAWSDARNVSFTKGAIQRSPLHRVAYPSTLFSTDLSEAPVGGFTFRTPTDAKVITCGRNSRYYQWDTGGTLTDVSPDTAGWTTSENNDRVTYAFVGGVTYANRRGHVPIYRTPSDTRFDEIPDWDSTFRAGALREFKSLLIALNISKGAVLHPGMFKWSSEIQYGSPPPDWDLDNPASISGEDTLNDAKSGLVDGLALADTFIMYTSTDVYLVEYTGAPYILTPRKLFADDGIMSVNCAVEVAGRHFVFGTKDIYIHDGISKQSIAEGRIKEYIYATLDFEYRDRCFVAHDKYRNEVRFYYPSILDESISSPTHDCNMVAVYNTVDDTWSLEDAPFAVSSVDIEVVPSETWNDLIDQQWDQMDSSWANFGSTGGTALSVVSAGTLSGAARPRILALDDAYGGRLTSPLATDFVPNSYAERQGIDLDSLGSELSGRRMIRSMFPQCVTSTENVPLRIALGSAAFSSLEPNYEPTMNFSPYTMYKVDSRVNGRYLAMKFEGIADEYWKLSGFDLDIIPIAGR